MDAWKRRYFAGYNDNEVYVFSNGKTSYTYTDDEKPVIYRHAKLAEIPFNKDLFYQLYEQLLKSLKHRKEHEYEEEFAGPAMG